MTAPSTRPKSGRIEAHASRRLGAAGDPPAAQAQYELPGEFTTQRHGETAGRLYAMDTGTVSVWPLRLDSPATPAPSTSPAMYAGLGWMSAFVGTVHLGLSRRWNVRAGLN